MDFDFTKRVLAALEAHRVRYTVFGKDKADAQALKQRFRLED